MIWFAYFGSAVAISYWVGRNHAGYGIAVFIAAVAIWQLINDGPSGFIGGTDCYTDWDGRTNPTVCD